jgi:acyl carrier protein
VLVRFETPTLNRMARDGSLPPILSGLVRARPARRETTETLQRWLASVPQEEWPQIVLDLVRDQVAAIQSLDSRDEVEPQLAFKEIGFDSLAAVELRNGLMRATRLQLPATLVFDHPTPAAVAEHMLGQIGPVAGAANGTNGGGAAIDTEFERIERLLERLAADESGRAQVESRVRAFTARVRRLLDEPEDDAETDLASVSDEEMFAMIDEELGA